MKIKYIIGLLLCCAVSVSAQRSYTAGEIQSNTEVRYGRFEIMMYSSDVSGTTSTFFLWKNGGQESSIRWNELDVETFGKSADQWQSNPIWEYSGADQNTKRWEGVHSGLPISNNWVKFTLEWTPEYIAWFNNDKEVRRILKGENVPASHHRYNNGDSDDPVGYIADPMRMCFNHWATFPGDWLGTWNDADLPSYQFVDWLTYQKWNGTGFDAVSIRHDFNSIAEITADYAISTHTFTENQCQFSTRSVGVTNGYLWLGIFKSGQEAAPSGAQIPAGAAPPPVQAHLLPKKIEAEEFSAQSGLQTEPVAASEGAGLNVGYTDAGDYAEYAIEVPATGLYSIDARVASLNGNAGFAITAGGTDSRAEIAVAATGGWQSWVTVRDTIALSAGKHTMRWTVTKAGCNVNWLDFQYIPQLPELAFTTISKDQIVAPGTDLTVSVHAAHTAGIAHVQLFVDGILLSQISNAPFDWRLAAQDIAPGIHTLRAVAAATSGEVSETSIGITVLSSQTIVLQQGWNLISTNVHPADSSIAALFNGLDLAEIKTMNTYWRKDQPSFLNPLQAISAGEGYLVKMNAPGTLTVAGTPFKIQNPTFNISTGWSLIGCPYPSAAPIAGIFGSMFWEIKDFSGFGIQYGATNTLHDLVPGKGYFVKTK